MSLVAGSRLAAADAASTVPADGSKLHPPELEPNSAGHTATALLSGAMAGIAIDGVLHPIDTLKARSMTPDGGRMVLSVANFAALWEGLGAALLPAIPSSGAFFLAYETLKRSLEHNRMFVPAGADGVP